eukprot:1156436-Prymnesium_polylepis.1
MPPRAVFKLSDPVFKSGMHTRKVVYHFLRGSSIQDVRSACPRRWRAAGRAQPPRRRSWPRVHISARCGSPNNS